MVHVVLRSLMLNVWLMGDAQNIFPRSSGKQLILVMMVIPIMQGLTMASLLKRMGTYMTIGMLFHTTPIFLQDITVISMWRFVLLFKLSNTSTNTFIKGMTELLWRFLQIKREMRSKNTWIQDISLLLNLAGTYLNLACMQNIHLSCACLFICKMNN